MFIEQVPIATICSSAEKPVVLKFAGQNSLLKMLPPTRCAEVLKSRQLQLAVGKLDVDPRPGFSGHVRDRQRPVSRIRFIGRAFTGREVLVHEPAVLDL